MFNSNLTKRDKFTLISLLLVLLMAIAIIVGVVAAKYIQEKRTPGKIKISVDVADSLIMYEHEAERNPEGDYTLGDETTDNNEDLLMPGVEIPNDPTIRIVQYTGLKSWLYVEITGTAPETVRYELTADWAPLMDGETQVTGPNGGKVYYKEIKATENDDIEYPADIDVQVLKVQDEAGNTLIVSQNVARSTSFELKFCAYIAQQTDTALNDFAQFSTTQTPDETGSGN